MKKIAVGTIIALTAVLMIAAVPVYAQEGTPPAVPGGRGGDGHFAGGMNNGERLGNLAEKLGMTLEELQAELDSGSTIRDLMTAAGIEVTPPERTGNGERQQALAEQLGMTVEELQAELDAGTTMRDLIEEAGIELEGPGRPGDGSQLESMAEQLGMTVEDLQAELSSGKSIHELADEAGVVLERPERPAGGRQGNRGGEGTEG